jgi:MFS family permease
MGRRGVPVTIAVFVSGAVLLGLEIAASRVLAPYIGNSLYVWGALIGVVLAGLAVGYWLGGTLADRWPKPWLLAERWQKVRERRPPAPDLATAIRDRVDEQIPTDDVPTATDDYAPTDALLLVQ